MEQCKEGLVTWEVLIDPECMEDKLTQEQQYKIQHQLEKPLSLFTASTDPDILYLHEALQASDCKEFLKAMDMEITGQEKGNHWIVVP